ncbi:MAG: DegV family protein [Candidatus Geothermincolales bacterium]
MAVAVVTGSQTCIPKEMVNELGITILPYTLILDGKEYLDGVDISPEEFYRLLPSLNGEYGTSSISPGLFLETFRKLSSRFQGILVITISSSMSGEYNNARLAAEMFHDVPVMVLDSKTAALAQGLVALKAARAAKAGASLEECYRIASESASKVRLLAYIQTFEYLKKSGRVKAVAALAADALSIKPVFAFREGKVDLVGKRRSTEKARELIADMAHRYWLENGQLPLEIAVFHASAPDDAKDLEERITSRVPIIGEVIFSEFTPVMGIHTGPGVVGAAFLPS